MEQHGSSGVMASLPSLKSSGPLCTTNGEEITIVSSKKRLTKVLAASGHVRKNYAAPSSTSKDTWEKFCNNTCWSRIDAELERCGLL